jgi:tripeptide aminopeptidase
LAEKRVQVARGAGTFFSSIGRLFAGRNRAGAARAPRSEIGPFVRRILSDAILLNEIPSPTAHETARIEFIRERMSEAGYARASLDEVGNLSVVIPASGQSAEHVLLFAEVGCEDYSPVDNMTKLEPERVRGRGITGSSIASAALLVLAEYLARNEIHYDRNVVILFTSFDPGEPTVQPLEHFLETWKRRVRFAAHIRGLELGRVEDRPLGTCRLSLVARTTETDLVGKEPAASAILVLAAVANRLGSIRWDKENETFLNIARLEAGFGFGWQATEGMLELEIFSPSAPALEIARQAVQATIATIARETGAQIETVVKASLPAGDPQINADLSAIVRGVHDRLHVKSRPYSLPGYASFLNFQGIPAVALGITTGRKSSTEEYIDIRPVETGFRQLLALLEELAGRRKEPRA